MTTTRRFTTDGTQRPSVEHLLHLEGGAVRIALYHAIPGATGEVTDGAIELGMDQAEALKSILNRIV